MTHGKVRFAATGLFAMIAAAAPAPTAAQLAADWMIPAAAHERGSRGTAWRTDLSIHNPHEFDLPVVVQLLPSDTANLEVPTLNFTVYPWETVNLWDVLGPDGFDFDGSGALLAYADPSLPCEPIEDCHFLVTSRTYTLARGGGAGEYGLTVPGAAADHGMDWSTFAYAAGVLNDGASFRCNAGVASWTADWTTVRLDIQDADGMIVSTEVYDVPPFGHIQWRLPTTGFGGSLVFYLESGPNDALVFPYATVINQETGDASYLSAEPSVVGASVAKHGRAAGARPETPAAGRRVAASLRFSKRTSRF
jgi:hypothetical protein